MKQKIKYLSIGILLSLVILAGTLFVSGWRNGKIPGLNPFPRMIYWEYMEGGIEYRTGTPIRRWLDTMEFTKFAERYDAAGVSWFAKQYDEKYQLTDQDMWYRFYNSEGTEFLLQVYVGADHGYEGVNYIAINGETFPCRNIQPMTEIYCPVPTE